MSVMLAIHADSILAMLPEDLLVYGLAASGIVLVLGLLKRGVGKLLGR